MAKPQPMNEPLSQVEQRPDHKYFGQEYDIRTYRKPFTHNGEVIGYPFCLNDMIEKLGKESIPDELGIYHLHHMGRLVYVGMSRRLRGRLLYHLKDDNMVFDAVLWFCASTVNWTLEDVMITEMNMIKLYRPSLNTSGISAQ